MNPNTLVHRGGRRDRRATPNYTATGTKQPANDTKGSGGTRRRRSCLLFLVSLVTFVVGVPVDRLFPARSAVRTYPQEVKNAA